MKLLHICETPTHTRIYIFLIKVFLNAMGTFEPGQRKTTAFEYLEQCFLQPLLPNTVHVTTWLTTESIAKRGRFQQSEVHHFQPLLERQNRKMDALCFLLTS